MFWTIFWRTKFWVKKLFKILRSIEYDKYKLDIWKRLVPGATRLGQCRLIFHLPDMIYERLYFGDLWTRKNFHLQRFWIHRIVQNNNINISNYQNSQTLFIYCYLLIYSVLKVVFFKILSFKFKSSKTGSIKYAAQFAAYFLIWVHGHWLRKVYGDMVT